MSQMYRFLMRWQDDDATLYYAGGWQSGYEHAGEGDCIGVCQTPKGDRPRKATSLEQFRENVEGVSIDVIWFDEPLTERGGDDG